jgi:hypothetical protein
MSKFVTHETYKALGRADRELMDRMTVLKMRLDTHIRGGEVDNQIMRIINRDLLVLGGIRKAIAQYKTKETSIPKETS